MFKIKLISNFSHVSDVHEIVVVNFWKVYGYGNFLLVYFMIVYES